MQERMVVSLGLLGWQRSKYLILPACGRDHPDVQPFGAYAGELHERIPVRSPDIGI